MITAGDEAIHPPLSLVILDLACQHWQNC